MLSAATSWYFNILLTYYHCLSPAEHHHLHLIRLWGETCSKIFFLHFHVTIPLQALHCPLYMLLAHRVQAKNMRSAILHMAVNLLLYTILWKYPFKPVTQLLYSFPKQSPLASGKVCSSKLHQQTETIPHKILCHFPTSFTQLTTMINNMRSILKWNLFFCSFFFLPLKLWQSLQCL